MGTANIDTLPLELLNRICCFIDSPRDLLSVAMTSKYLNNSVIHNNSLYMRVIQCGYNREHLWRSLIQRPTLAAEMRFLDIVQEKTSPGANIRRSTEILIPKLGDEDKNRSASRDDAGALSLLPTAIRGMRHLQRFHWSAAQYPEEELFLALKENCLELNEVELLAYSDMPFNPGEMQYPDGWATSHLWSFSNLTSFSYSEFFRDNPDNGHEQCIASLTELLVEQCHGLENLQLFFRCGRGRFVTYPKTSMQRLMKRARWPKLKRLSIDNYALIGSDARFLNAHPTLETVQLYGLPGHVPQLWRLPNLSHLHVDQMPPLSQVGKEGARNLRHFTLFLYCDYLVEGCMNEDMHREFFEAASALKSLTIRSYDYFCRRSAANIAKYVTPSLRRFAIVNRQPMMPRSNLDKGDTIEILTALQYLTHFSPIYLESWASRDENLDSWVMAALAAVTKHAPNLRFVCVRYRVDDLECSGWVQVERLSEQVFSGFSWVSRYGFTADIDVDRWGSPYFGAGYELLFKSRGDLPPL